jgi:hypothetical protein
MRASSVPSTAVKFAAAGAVAVAVVALRGMEGKDQKYKVQNTNFKMINLHLPALDHLVLCIL